MACRILTFWAVAVDAVVVALPLAVRGAAALPAIVDYVVPNSTVVLFQPLTVGSTSLPVPVLDVAVVTLLVVLNAFPGRRLSWRRDEAVGPCSAGV